MMMFFFGRLHGTIFHLELNSYATKNGFELSHNSFGIHGKNDLSTFIAFMLLSTNLMLNSSYSVIEPQTFLAHWVCTAQSGIGYIFVALLIATFVEISTNR